MVAWLDRCGIPLCYPPVDLGEESQITAVRDPDGNLVELTQLGPGWLGRLKANRAEGNDLVALMVLLYMGGVVIFGLIAAAAVFSFGGDSYTVPVFAVAFTEGSPSPSGLGTMPRNRISVRK